MPPSGVLGLEDELPARMRHGKQEHISRPMGAQIVQDGVDPLDLGGQPGIDLVQEVGEVDRRAAVIGLGYPAVDQILARLIRPSPSHGRYAEFLGFLYKCDPNRVMRA